MLSRYGSTPRGQIGAPILPTCLPTLGSCLHSARSKGFVCKAKVTHVTTLQFRWKTVQDFWSGRGKKGLNMVSKSSSVLHFQAGLLPNDCEETSEITLCLPSICIGVSGQACWIFRRSTMAWTRVSATRDNLEARCATQPIKGELSPKSAMRFSLSGPHTPSIASQNSKRMAISRSKFVIVQVGLSTKTTCNQMSQGYCQRNSVGVHAKSLPKITPLMLWLEASTIPMKSGHPHVILQHLVGSCVDSHRSVQHPLTALRAFMLRWK
jgi:hypothetical protein